MEIKKSDIDAARKVLQRKKSREEVATEYSIRHKTVVAMVILHGAGVTEQDLKPRGTFSNLLWYLIVVPAMPPDGWLRDPDAEYPEWREKIYSDTLVERSRQLGLHRSKNRSGHGISLTPQEMFDALLAEDDRFVRICKRWYNEACRAIRKQKGK